MRFSKVDTYFACPTIGSREEYELFKRITTARVKALWTNQGEYWQDAEEADEIEPDSEEVDVGEAAHISDWAEVNPEWLGEPDAEWWGQADTDWWTEVDSDWWEETDVDWWLDESESETEEAKPGTEKAQVGSEDAEDESDELEESGDPAEALTGENEAGNHPNATKDDDKEVSAEETRLTFSPEAVVCGAVVSEVVPVPQFPPILEIHGNQYKSYRDLVKNNSILHDLPPKEYRQFICVFCKGNNEEESVYTSHAVRVDGVVTCPYLRHHVCQLCKETGDNAHTIKYCLQNKRGFFAAKAKEKETSSDEAEIYSAASVEEASSVDEKIEKCNSKPIKGAPVQGKKGGKKTEGKTGRRVTNNRDNGREPKSTAVSRYKNSKRV